ncbi:MAG: ACP S-malonyltransferase [Betaproteobacteria bacterium]|nr:ACP S-malonyltransferase [Betaproteobacteria bacterium]
MKLALVFPGQGSQAVGMLQSFADSRPVRDTFAEASDALKQDLWKLAGEGPADELNSTLNTQPLMLTAGYAVYRAWRAAGGAQPAVVAGHSLGEYTALVAAGVVSFRDALPLVRFRAQAMQEAVPLGTGAMAAILGLDDDAVRAACEDAAQGGVVEAVNFNAPNQVVIAGHKAAVERGTKAAKGRGAKRAVMLPVSAPFHSSLLKPAAQRLGQYLDKVIFSAPQIPVVNNVDAAVVSEPRQIKDALARQACNPVRWVEVIRRMAGIGVTHVAECGPGKVLAGLTRRIDGSLQGLAIADAPSLTQVLQTLQQVA